MINPDTIELEAPDVDISELLEQNLILHNDEVNPFDHIVNSLVYIVKMDEVQAEQCTMIAHYKGKCAIKSGTYDDLLPYKTGLNDEGIEATIE